MYFPTKKFLPVIILSFIAALPACQNSSHSKSPGAEHEQGGVSTGGGDSVITHPVGTESVHQILKLARPELIFYFNRNETTLNSDVYGLLFQKEQTLYDVIQNIKIHEAATGSCYDKSGQETDGSVYSPEPNSICISTYRLGQKLTPENIHSQTIALVAHEYSHLLGTSEEQAIALQTEVWQNLLNVSQDQFNIFLRRLHAMLGFAIGSIDPLLENSEAFSDLQFYQQLNIAIPFHSKLSRVFDSLEAIPFSVSKARDKTGCYTCNPFMKGNLENYLAKATALEIGSGILAQVSDSNGDFAKYTKAFAGKLEISASEFETKMDPTNLPMASEHFMLHKITNRKIALEELQNIRTYFQQLEDYLQFVESTIANE